MTDRVIPIGSWNIDAPPDVGWRSEAVPPQTFTLHVASAVNLGAVTLRYGESNGAGGLRTPLGFGSAPVDDTRGPFAWVMLSEVAFAVADVPLPAAAPLMLVGLGAPGLSAPFASRPRAR